MSLSKSKTKKKITSQAKNINNTIEEKIKQYLNDKNQEYNNQRFIKFSNKSLKKIREYCNFNHNTKDNEIKNAVYKIYLFAVFNPEWFENHDKIKGGLLNFVIEINNTIQTTDFEELSDGPYKNNKIDWLKENIDAYNENALEFKTNIDFYVDKLYISEINSDLQNINSNKLPVLINPGLTKSITISKSSKSSTRCKTTTHNNSIKKQASKSKTSNSSIKSFIDNSYKSKLSTTILLKGKRCPWGYRYNKSLKLCRLLCNINNAKKRIIKMKKL
jgi:hypothetical protein